MDDGIEARDVVDLRVTNVLLDGRHRGKLARKVARPVEVTIHSHHGVIAFQQHEGQDRSDVAAISCQQNLH